MRSPNIGRLHRWASAAAITLAVAAVLVHSSGKDALLSAFTSIRPGSVLWLLTIYLTAQLLRTWRFQLLLRSSAPRVVGRLGAIVVLHQLGNHLLPVRLGELAFPFLCRRYAEITMERASSVLLQVRIQETYALALLLLAAVLVHSSAPGDAGEQFLPAWIVVVSLFVLAGGVALERLIPGLLNRAGRISLYVGNRTGRIRPRIWSERLAGFLERTSAEAELPVPLLVRFAGLFLTLMLWFTMFFLFHEVMRLTGNQVSLAQTVIGSSFSNLTQLLPINTIGSVGSLEAGWTLGFALVGVEPRAALASSIVLHSLVIGFLILLGSASYFWLRHETAQRQNRRAKN